MFAASKATVPADGLGSLTSTLNGFVERGELAGLVLLVHRRDQEIYFRAIGSADRENAIPMRRDNLFRIASMTKPVAAVAALRLVESGRIGLFDPIDRWLPELADRQVLIEGGAGTTTPSPRPIVLHDLLTMRAGFGWGVSPAAQAYFGLVTDPLGTALGVVARGASDPGTWMQQIAALPLLDAPGERVAYHTSFDVLGVLIARVTGQSLAGFMQGEIFDPLGMVDTSFFVPPQNRNRLATLYRCVEGGALTRVEASEAEAWAHPPANPSGGGGLVSSVDDYQRFARMLMAGGTLDGKRILSRRSVDAMTTDYLTSEQHARPFFSFDRYDADNTAMWTNKGYGYGVSIRTERVGLGPSVGSFYWPGATGTTWIADPAEELCITLLTQVTGQNPVYPRWEQEGFAMVYRAVAGKSPSDQV